MALLVFPPNPYNGEIFPVNPPAGVNVYRWDSPDQTWRLEGTATGVVPGTYGSPTEIPVFTVDVVGRLVAASQVPIAVATTTSTGVVQVGANLEITGTGILSVPFADNTQAGVVQLTDSSTDCSPNKALSGVVGCHLQAEIDALKAETHLTFAGTVNATTGRMTSITAKGAAAGFTVGGLMVAPSAANIEYLVIVSQPGTFAPPNSLTYTCTVGDWLVSNGVQWIFYNVGPEAAVLVQLDDISGAFDDTQQVFPLTLGGVPYTPTSQSNILVSLGGVLQMPGTAFTISGSNIDFADPPLTGTTFLAYVISGATGGGGGGGGGTGTVTSVGTGLGLTGGPITTTGTISLRVATPLSLGGVIPDGTTITVSPSGVISAAPISGANLQQITNNGSITTNSITTGGLVSNGSVTLGSSPINLLNVVARVSSNFIPSANQTYDLGSATNRWRDLYVSSNSIYMGSNQLTVSGGQLLLNGVPVGGGATLQQVTDNGATTTNNITLDNSDLLVKDGSGNTRIQLSAGTSLFSGPVSMASSGAATTNPILTIGNSNSILWSGGSSQTIKISNQSIRFGMAGFGIDIYGQNVGATSSYSLYLPNAQGAAGTTLVNDGTGQLSWGTGGGSVGTLQTVTDNGATTTNPIQANTITTTGNYQISRGGASVGLLSGDASSTSYLPSPLSLPDGSVSSPSLRFASAQNTGLYYDSTLNSIYITNNGNYEIQIGNNTTTFFSNIQVPNSYTASFTGTLSFNQSGGNVRFYDFDNSNYVGFRGPSVVTSDVSWILPSADGTSGQVLTTDGAGTLGWLSTAQVVAVPANSGAGGAAGQIAFGNGFFYWFDTASGQWLRVAGNTF